MPKKTWTDKEIDELKNLYGTMSVDELISKHFPTKTRSSIKWQVERWRLGQVQHWSEKDIEQLKTLCECNVPAKLISELLNRPKQAVYNKASNIGFLRKTRDEQTSPESSSKRKIYNKLDDLTKGTINELEVISKLLEEGFQVFRPLMINHKTDLMILHGQSAIRIQVKTGVYDERTKRYRVPLRSKAPNKGTRISYSSEDVDFFIVTCPGIGAFYIIPFEQGIKTEFVNLYPTRVKQKHIGIDYEQFKGCFDLLECKKKVDLIASNPPKFAKEHEIYQISSTGRRSWLDWEKEAIKLLLSNGIPYSVVASVLKRSKESVIQKANELGLTSRKNSAEPYDDLFKQYEFLKKIDSKITGVMTENNVANQLLSRGYDLFSPCRTNDRIDFVILGSNSGVRVQVKGAIYNAKSNYFKAEISTKNVKNKKRKQYSNKEIDFFLIKCSLSPDLYVIPITEVKDKYSLNLFPNRHVQSQRGPDYEGFLNRFDLIDDFLNQS